MKAASVQEKRADELFPYPGRLARWVMAALLSPKSMFQLPEPGEGELETNITLRVGKTGIAAS